VQYAKKQEDERKCQGLTLSKNVASKNTPVSAFWKIWIVMHCSVVTENPLHPSFTRPLISPIPALVNGQCQNLSMPVRNGTCLRCQSSGKHTCTGRYGSRCVLYHSVALHQPVNRPLRSAIWPTCPMPVRNCTCRRCGSCAGQVGSRILSRLVNISINACQPL